MREMVAAQVDPFDSDSNLLSRMVSEYLCRDRETVKQFSHLSLVSLCISCGHDYEFGKGHSSEVGCLVSGKDRGVVDEGVPDEEGGGYTFSHGRGIFCGGHRQDIASESGEDIGQPRRRSS